jgi:Cu/Ag efflux protein CusF
MISNKLILTATLAAALAVGCSKHEQQTSAGDSSASSTAAPAPTNPQVVGQGDGHGVVKAMSAKDSSVTLDHNTIPGVMDAMAMQYKIDKPDMLSGLSVGDSVNFTLQDRGEGNYVVTAIKKK